MKYKPSDKDTKIGDMKKKIFVLVAMFVLLNLGQSCRTEHYLIVDIEINAASIEENNNDKQKIYYDCTTSIKDKLVFVISYKTEFLHGYIPNSGNVCYALTLPRVNDNELLHNTFSLKFDKTFIYQDNEIPALTNIFEIETIAKEIDKYEKQMYRGSTCGMGADFIIDFSDNFFNNSIFDTTEDYIVIFSCETSDEKFFEKTTTIKFEK